DLCESPTNICQFATFLFLLPSYKNKINSKIDFGVILMSAKIAIFVVKFFSTNSIMIDIPSLKKLIEEAWENRQLLEYKEYYEAIEFVIQHLDKGELRVAEPVGESWFVNDWIKKAVILYFPIRDRKSVV